MSFYVVLRKPINTGIIFGLANNPSQKELMKDIINLPKVYLLTSLEDAEKVANYFFHSPVMPKVFGKYGLIAEVKVTFDNLPNTTEIDNSEIFNNWVDSQRSNYNKMQPTGDTCSSIIVSSEQIISISQTIIPDEAKTYNPNLEDTNFESNPKCIIM